VVMPLSGVFYPVNALPAALRPIAQALPTTHAFAAGRAYAAGEPTPWHEIGLAVLGTAGLCAVALAYLGWVMRIFRKRGHVPRCSCRERGGARRGIPPAGRPAGFLAAFSDCRIGRCCAASCSCCTGPEEHRTRLRTRRPPLGCRANRCPAALVPPPAHPL